MTTFGLVPEGFVLKTLRDILSEVEQDQKSNIDPGIDVSPQAPTGQHNGVYSRQLALVWELMQLLNDGRDPDKAEGDQLISLCKLTGTVPQGATYTEVDADCELASGTTLTAGSDYAAVESNPDVRFTPKEDFTADSDDTFSIRFRAENAGPIVVNANKLTVIATPVSGWDSVNNPLDATTGQAADSDTELRGRRVAELAAAGSSTARAIRADVLQIEDEDGNRNVQQALVLENDTNYTDANGLPPHSFEVVVYDSPEVDDDLIAQVVFDSKAAGIRPRGSESGTALDDEGVEYTVPFSRADQIEIYVTYTLVTNAQYVGDAVFKETVATELNALHDVADDVLVWACQRAAALTGVVNVTDVKIGFSASPTESDDLTIADREIARFDSTRIVV